MRRAAGQVTTIKVSEATRDRIKARGGTTHEATIIAALDALDQLDDDRFWAQADAAAAWRRTLPSDERERVRRREAGLDALFDGLE